MFRAIIRLAVLASACMLFTAASQGADSGATSAQSQIAARSQTITVGRVSSDTVKTAKRLQALAKYLAEKLKPMGISEGKAVVARSNEEMISMLQRGEVDIVSESVFSALQFADEGGARPILREWKKGVASYHTILLTRKGSGLRSLNDLRGKVIAFEDPGSTSAFYIPLAMLRQAGLETVEVKHGQKPPPGKVGYIFTNGEVNVAAWVSKGLADAGAISNLDWDDIGRTPNTLKATLEIFDTSPPVLRSVLLVRGDMPDDLRRAVSDVMTRMHEDPEGKEVLKTYYKVKKYDAISGTVAQDLEGIRRLVPLLQDVMM